MTAIYDKYRILVQRLYKRTIDRLLTWKTDEWGDIYCQVGDKTISLNRGRNENDEPLYVLTLKNENDQVLDRFDDEQIAGVPPTDQAFETQFALLKALHELGTRQATGADVALDELLDELDEEIPF